MRQYQMMLDKPAPALWGPAQECQGEPGLPSLLLKDSTFFFSGMSLVNSDEMSFPPREHHGLDVSPNVYAL